MQGQPNERVAVAAAVDPQVLQDGTYGTDAVDMARFHEALFIVMVGSVPTGGSLAFKLQESPNGSSGWQDLAGKAITTLSDTNDNKQAIVQVKSEQLSAGYRFVRGLVSASDHANVGAVLGLALNPRYGPASDDQHADVLEVV